MIYRFPRWKDATWNSYDRQRERYEVIRPFLGDNLIGAEIGVYKGGFGEFLIGHCKKLYLVDSWYRASGFWNSGIPADSRVDTVINILSIYKSEIECGTIEVIIDFSNNFLRSVGGDKFDFIYIDSSHQYEYTLAELSLARTALKKGGLLFGDDYDPDPNSKQHGVYRAVSQFVADAGARMIVNESRQWGLAFPEDVAHQ
jgi:hypothetical protein